LRLKNLVFNQFMKDAYIHSFVALKREFRFDQHKTDTFTY
jgi:hypothetical protein